ncbi:FHA domain-containing protein [Zavarzinella formosa]|uniref:FHA domain-containing protein n=1 Tax=Zavarzinella formosa TaxID=360055 RepID=UPI000313A04E|nr:FHA domain-containing protein [Zavarzinella formosa]
MPAQLLALTDGPSILLDKPIVLLGRHAECDLQLNSRKVSRRHCCVAIVKDYLVVRDLGSTNGIRINGERVVEGTLKAGDELTIGNFRYQVYLDGAVIPSPASPPPKKPSATASDESLLEASDEPVPLEESRNNGKVLPAKPAKPAMKPMLLEHDDSFVLPEKLRAVPPPDRRG